MQALSHSPNMRGGFTLLEVVIVMCIIALVLTAVYTLSQGTLTLADQVQRASQQDSRQQAFVGFCEHWLAALPASSALNLRTTQDGAQYLSTLELENVPSPFNGSPDCRVSLFTEPVLGGGLKLRLSCRKPAEPSQDITVDLFDDIARCEWRAFDRATGQWTTVWNEPGGQNMTHVHPVLMEMSLTQAGTSHRYLFWIAPSLPPGP